MFFIFLPHIFLSASFELAHLLVPPRRCWVPIAIAPIE